MYSTSDPLYVCIYIDTKIQKYSLHLIPLPTFKPTTHSKQGMLIHRYLESMRALIGDMLVLGRVYFGKIFGFRLFSRPLWQLSTPSCAPFLRPPVMDKWLRTGAAAVKITVYSWDIKPLESCWRLSSRERHRSASCLDVRHWIHILSLIPTCTRGKSSLSSVFSPH